LDEKDFLFGIQKVKWILFLFCIKFIKGIVKYFLICYNLLRVFITPCFFWSR
jgi:hypothetical protein